MPMPLPCWSAVDASRSMLRRCLSPVTVCAEAEAEENSEEASMKLYHKVGLSFVVSALRDRK
jgi:hypothetical protein